MKNNYTTIEVEENEIANRERSAQSHLTVDNNPSKPRVSNLFRLLLLLPLLALLLAAGAWLLRGKTSQPGGQTNAANSGSSGAGAAASGAATTSGSDKPQPVEVATASAIRRELPRTLEVVGSLIADEEVIVSAQAAGEIASLNVDFGNFVQQGQVIAQIDQRDAKLRIEQAEAALKQTLARVGLLNVREGEKFDPEQNAEVRVARSQLDWARMDLERATKLVEKGDIARSIYDQAVTNHNAARARYQVALDAVNQQLAVIEQQRSAINLARKSLTDTVVRSPISGAVKEKLTARGAFVPVGGRIVSLVRIHPLRLRADIPEASAASVRVGQSVRLTTETFPDRTFTGLVRRLGASLDERTRALTIEAEVSNPGYQLRPGMFAKVQVITQKNASAVMIAQAAVVNSAGLSKVFVIENGKAVERMVRTGVTDGEMIEIVDGVRENETVAVSNTDKLQNGSSVQLR
jgi:RND family efflux transporter MFP subunit